MPTLLNAPASGKICAIAEAQLRDYQASLGIPFSHESYLSQLTTLRDQLKAGLSGAAPETNGDSQPTVIELAGPDQGD